MHGLEYITHNAKQHLPIAYISFNCEASIISHECTHSAKSESILYILFSIQIVFNALKIFFYYLLYFITYIFEILYFQSRFHISKSMQLWNVRFLINKNSHYISVSVISIVWCEYTL